MVRLFIMILLLSAALTTHAQTKSSLKIPTISGQLFWHNAAKRCTMKDGELMIVTGEKTDLVNDPAQTAVKDNAPKLMFKADPNFVLSATVRHPFTARGDGGGIVIKADSLNWVKLSFEKDHTGAHRVVSVVTKGISDYGNSVEIEDDIAHLKVAKADNVISMYCSKNGRNWFLVRHFQFEAKNGLVAGFLAQSPSGKGSTITFSDIKYQTKKIKDLATGE